MEEEIPEERKIETEDTQKKYDKIKTSTEIVSQILDDIQTQIINTDSNHQVINKNDKQNQQQKNQYQSGVVNRIKKFFLIPEQQIKFDPKNPLFLTDFLQNVDFKFQEREKILTIKNFVHYYDQSKKMQLFQVNTINQIIGNACGFHAAFNIIQSLKMLKSQNLEIIYNPLNKNNMDFPIYNTAQFWKFKKQINDQIWKYAQKYQDISKWPWSYYDCQYGDFERTYWNYCQKYNKIFQEAFQSDQNFDIDVCTWSFQFGRLILGDYDMQNLQNKFDQFRNFKTNNKHKVIVFMLGINSHWQSLIAHKYNDRQEVYFFDSYNKDILNWAEKEITEYIQEIQNKKQNEGKQPLKDFNIWVFKNSIIDTQISIKLITDCLLGNTSLVDYKFNSDFKVFANQFEEDIVSQIYNKNNKNSKIQNLNDDQSLLVLNWVENHYIDLQRFLLTKNSITFLDQNNRSIVAQMKELINLTINQLVVNYPHVKSTQIGLIQKELGKHKQI
ncbi:hypothetical protein PPERSA_10086 [Pseudocohnilembus persalinus]|uniref:Uncharacterized protein n=1 Tax=Pseudocohnilembus persalinus TaxID=266149 RepID=A0A0V0QKC1_PSEPJ|nr:hypothetical protein PPERSA_10086 [Pseudocohnilembus persalinus]|eukprot:KRX02469.1 hypothetical protein PPERSA_10086 [Pseudocohnilembus persalinus]